MDIFRACSIVEGFDGEEHTIEEVLSAWQYLLDIGIVWKLQGSYGRGAQRLIEEGLITVKGKGDERSVRCRLQHPSQSRWVLAGVGVS